MNASPTAVNEEMDEVVGVGISEEIRRMRPPSVFSLNGPLIHIFISYRVTSEQEMSDQLHEAIVQLSRDPCFAIPPGARGKRCQASEPKCAPKECKVFLDRLCLLDGRDWEAGFVLSLAHSVVFVPLLSWGPGNTGVPQVPHVWACTHTHARTRASSPCVRAITVCHTHATHAHTHTHTVMTMMSNHCSRANKRS